MGPITILPTDYILLIKFVGSLIFRELYASTAVFDESFRSNCYSGLVKAQSHLVPEVTHNYMCSDYGLKKKKQKSNVFLYVLVKLTSALQDIIYQVGLEWTAS